MNPGLFEIPSCPTHEKRFVQLRSRFGPFWACPERGCDWRVGAHKDNGRPLGTAADQATRQARIAAHAVFDPLWTKYRTGKIRHRFKAYAWLARQLGIPVSECHIARFDRGTCERVVQVCQQRVMQ